MVSPGARSEVMYNRSLCARMALRIDEQRYATLQSYAIVSSLQVGKHRRRTSGVEVR